MELVVAEKQQDLGKSLNLKKMYEHRQKPLRKCLRCQALTKGHKYCKPCSAEVRDEALRIKSIKL